ncbi:biotin/lipoyl-containing protein [Actinoplanes sp. NPDC051859]|uniref:biotin/lipoyl-containing protein n=1 Tax=Actinoplanes sp. NPDC051859 TaxID=3363909 RepID=UPI0037893520
MDLVGSAVLVVSLGVLIAAVLSRGRPAPVTRPFLCLAALLWLMLAGDAAFGEHRPMAERQWKGVAALLLALAAVVQFVKHHRERRRDTATRTTHHDSPATFITMPSLGTDVCEGTVTRWLKRVGDPVHASEPLVEIAIAKAAVEIPAGTSGVLREIQVAAGETAPVGTPIAVISAP